MTKYIAIKENGKVLFRLVDLPEFDLNKKIDDIIAHNILRGHERITKSQAMRLAIFFYHKQLTEGKYNDEAFYTLPARVDEHADEQ